MVRQPALDPRTPVATFLAAVPQAARVFLDLRMGCVGCPLSGIDTLEVAAATYGLPWEAFAARLAAVMAPGPAGRGRKRAPGPPTPR